ncbi:hypothetical protein B0T20DRAFT_174062 [Sordaria brevicollis]|uniref:Uncharacterized protein n=1 Tax=Sordaria brevicollis TaxID=83679 RepID=A0AAE0UE06_SORBR|nr:hypothetical protein B0T20DRAFT_174062 [Sordaria brevicollis]
MHGCFRKSSAKKPGPFSPLLTAAILLVPTSHHSRLFSSTSILNISPGSTMLFVQSTLQIICSEGSDRVMFTRANSMATTNQEKQLPRLHPPFSRSHFNFHTTPRTCRHTYLRTSSRTSADASPETIWCRDRRTHAFSCISSLLFFFVSRSRKAASRDFGLARLDVSLRHISPQLSRNASYAFEKLSLPGLYNFVRRDHPKGRGCGREGCS